MGRSDLDRPLHTEGSEGAGLKRHGKEREVHDREGDAFVLDVRVHLSHRRLAPCAPSVHCGTIPAPRFDHSISRFSSSMSKAGSSLDPTMNSVPMDPWTHGCRTPAHVILAANPKCSECSFTRSLRVGFSSDDPPVIRHLRPQSGGRRPGADLARTSSISRNSPCSAGLSEVFDLCSRSSTIRSGNPANASASSSGVPAMSEPAMGTYVGWESASDSIPSGWTTAGHRARTSVSRSPQQPQTWPDPPAIRRSARLEPTSLSVTAG